MSRAPPSPSFRPPKNRLRTSLPRIENLSISTTSIQPTKDEISPVVPLGPPVDSENVNNLDTITSTSRKSSNTLDLRISPPDSNDNRNTNTGSTRRQNSQSHYGDIYELDDEGWSRVANSGGIEELLALGEGVSGTVTKCRLRKSRQVFAIKVYFATRLPGY